MATLSALLMLISLLASKAEAAAQRQGPRRGSGLGHFDEHHGRRCQQKAGPGWSSVMTGLDPRTNMHTGVDNGEL